METEESLAKKLNVDGGMLVGNKEELLTVLPYITRSQKRKGKYLTLGSASDYMCLII